MGIFAIERVQTAEGAICDHNFMSPREIGEIASTVCHGDGGSPRVRWGALQFAPKIAESTLMSNDNATVVEGRKIGRNQRNGLAPAEAGAA
jgi:hypothetical protein